MINYKLNNNVFREYDIRGIVKQDFSKNFIYDLGLAIGTKFLSLGEKTIAISGDLRKTTAIIKTTLIDGLINTGINVIDLGILPTPINYYSMHALENINCCVQITGSHNSMEYNGFKISYNQGPFYGESIQELKKIIEDKLYTINGNGKVEYLDLLPNYISLLKSKISISRELSIAMDCLNSCAALVAPEIFKELSVNLIEIHCNPSEDCPFESPDPTLDENLEKLVKIIQNNTCDFGVAYDGDADRLVVVDEKGKIIRSDILLALFSDQLISNGDKVVYDVKCSKSVEDVIKSRNGIPVMYKTGHSYIKEKMQETNAIIGGEMSGHIFFADDYFGYDDAIYASLRLTEIIANSNQTLSELITKIPIYYSSREIRIECNNDEEKFKITNKLVNYFKERYSCNCIDGVKIKFDQGWGLVRASNTQPVLVCRFEADTAEQLKKIESIIMSKINSYL